MIVLPPFIHVHILTHLNLIGINGNMKSLSLDNRSKQATVSRTSRPGPPPDSWEEEAENDSTPSTPSASASGTSTPQEYLVSIPGPPPPTPMSPSHRRGKSTDWSAFPQHPYAQQQSPTSSPGASLRSQNRDTSPPSQRRPEKSAATAGRMIAGALGVKAPRMGEEAREYERVVREKEKRRLEQDREGRYKTEREKEEAKRAVWDE